MSRAEMRRAERASKKAEAKRYYTEAEFQAAVNEQVRIIRYNLEKAKAEDLMGDVQKMLDEDWKVQEHNCILEAFNLTCNYVLYYLYKKRGWGSTSLGIMASWLVKMFNDKPDLNEIINDLYEGTGIKIGSEDE